MFTGIIEGLGTVAKLETIGSNKRLTVKSELSKELKVDQSIANNGICLTVINCDDSSFQVDAVAETIAKTNLGHWKEGDKINLERCMLMNGRLDGHIVQGHVDQTAKVIDIQNQNGSWLFTFSVNGDTKLIVEKGSVCINGVSLTTFNLGDNSFSVAIIPYTYEHTNFHTLKTGDLVNIEFDIIGKYVQRLHS